MTKAKEAPAETKAIEKTPEVKALEPYQSSALGGQALPMSEIVERASEVATNLAKIIKDKELYTMIDGKAFVHVEGWTTLGALVGILPRTREVKKFPGGFEAYVDLVRARDGVVIGGASALCTSDEKGKSGFKPYALYSMAETRATGKAYRLAFSWIMKLAGYEATPWEEMSDVVEVVAREVDETVDKGEPRVEPKPRPHNVPRVPNQWEKHIVDKIEELQIFQARPHIINVLNRSLFFTEVPYGELSQGDGIAYCIRWMQVKNANPEMDIEERNKLVNESWQEALPQAYDSLGLTWPE